MSLPTLPKNEGLEKALGCSVVHYTEAIAYGQACRDAALEEAAMAAENGFKYALDGYQIADKIRSLKLQSTATNLNRGTQSDLHL